MTLADLTETVDSGIRHFTGYTLCLQYSNDAGMTDWAVPNDGTNLTEVQTTPGTPPAPRFDRGTNNDAGTERTLAWTVAGEEQYGCSAWSMGGSRHSSFTTP